MLPNHYRLKRSSDFSRVYRLGRKGVSEHFVVRVLAPLPEAQSTQAEPLLLEKPTRQQAGFVKVGIVVSQKVSKRAVVRNRLKRQVRAILAGLIPDFKPHLWVVINLRPGAEQCEYGEFLRELKQIFTQLEVIHGHS